METRTYYDVIDRTGWPSGPWDGEPDKVQWQDEATGLPCLVKRNQIGVLCGYVGVPASHAWYGRGYQDIEELVSVHGGLTYSDGCTKGDEAKSICHVPAEGEPDDVWWFGFDCGYYLDCAPSPRLQPFMSEGAYRTVRYVRSECARLAEQLVKAG